MNNKKTPEAAKKLLRLLKKYQYVLIVLFVGVIIFMIPTGSNKEEDTTQEVSGASELSFSIEEQEEKIAKALSQIAGAGEVTVVLSVKTSAEQEVAVDVDEERVETVIVSSASGDESVVTVKYVFPEYQGALIVAEGADSPEVKLEIIKAVANLTGLGTNKISVSKKGN